MYFLTMREKKSFFESNKFFINCYYIETMIWWRVVVHPTKLASLSGIILRFIFPPVAMLTSLITFKFKNVQKHWEEWKGFWNGLFNGIKYKISLYK